MCDHDCTDLPDIPLLGETEEKLKHKKMRQKNENNLVLPLELCHQFQVWAMGIQITLFGPETTIYKKPFESSNNEILCSYSLSITYIHSGKEFKK